MQSASRSVSRYLDQLPLTDSQRGDFELGLAAIPASEQIPQLHRTLAKEAAAAWPEHPAQASVASRLNMVYPQESTADRTPVSNDEAGNAKVSVAPPLHKKSMVPGPWGNLNPLSRWIAEKTHRFENRRAPTQLTSDYESVDGPDPKGHWQGTGSVRRLVLLTLMLLQTAMATKFMADVLPYHGSKPLEMVVLGLFALLFCWVSAGFWTAVAGFWVLITGKDKYLISRETAAEKVIAADARTAIVMPICNEDVERVFAGLRATYESLERTGNLDRFDFFILSDSNQADICVAEADAWSALCREIGGFGRIFYRHRRRRVKRKSGNIDDFCRRWGADYRYMIVLDADSVMSGDCLSTLVRLMEANPGAGIIQTAPRAAGRDTLYARIQQFSTRVYGPLFTAGLHYWQLGESHYWGHNAIIRVAPFMKHCALAPLPGDGAFSGPILSHDFVEASLMRRAGWSVWIAYDLDGSFEEMPPNLLDELSRDRRWCMGNLMNFRLFLVKGMHRVHRAVFVTGAMAYMSAPLWCLFLIMSTLLLASHTLIEPQYFTKQWQLFPIWPEWHPQEALALISATATLLFLPKILSLLVIVMAGGKGYGGRIRVAISVVLESLFSVLLAPVRMMFHTLFVIGAFLGINIGWKSPTRAENDTGWGEGIRRHGVQSLIGIVWGLVIYWLDPSFIWWSLPITASLAISVLPSVLSSRPSWGRAFRKAGFFLIPEEIDVPRELTDTVKYLEVSRPLGGFVDAVVNPVLNAQLCASHAVRKVIPARTQEANNALIDKAVKKGPAALSEQQKLLILDQPLLLSRLHLAVWSAPAVHKDWVLGIEQLAA
jgi:membrane glycosyltransferase